MPGLVVSGVQFFNLTPMLLHQVIPHGLERGGELLVLDRPLHIGKDEFLYALMPLKGLVQTINFILVFLDHLDVVHHVLG